MPRTLKATICSRGMEGLLSAEWALGPFEQAEASVKLRCLGCIVWGFRKICGLGSTNETSLSLLTYEQFLCIFVFGKHGMLDFSFDQTSIFQDVGQFFGHMVVAQSWLLWIVLLWLFPQGAKPSLWYLHPVLKAVLRRQVWQSLTGLRLVIKTQKPRWCTRMCDGKKLITVRIRKPLTFGLFQEVSEKKKKKNNNFGMSWYLSTVRASSRMLAPPGWKMAVLRAHWELSTLARRYWVFEEGAGSAKTKSIITHWRTVLVCRDDSHLC